MNSTNATQAVELNADILTTYTAIVTLAMIPIYIGSHLSVSIQKDDDDEDKETMTAKDAYTFPLIGSCFLFGLYLLFKLFNKDIINLILTTYFLFLGFFSLIKSFVGLKKLLPKSLDTNPSKFTVPAIPMIQDKPKVVHFTPADIILAVFCFIIICAYVMTKHWMLNNLLGLSFSIQGVALFGLGSYKIGCILLSGLFFYDIFWVFGTDVMVTVAKSFDAPIKLLFPKSLWAAEYQFSMLGLGDIVIPGVFIALLLRYDHHRHTKNNKKGKISTPYFNATFLGYFVGLVTTIFVMHTYQAAQPALLYLVPTCMGFSITTAIFLGDVSGLLEYNEEEKEKDKKEK